MDLLHILIMLEVDFVEYIVFVQNWALFNIEVQTIKMLYQTEFNK